MPDNEVVVHEFEKNGRELIRVRLTEFRGVPLVDIRSFYQDPPGSEEWKPGKGLAVRQDLLPELLDGLKKADEMIDEKRSRGKKRGGARGAEVAAAPEES